jgi:pilus assembly protein CpaB
MNLARIIVLIVALGAGGAAAYLAMNMINNQPETPQAPVQATVTPPPQPTIPTDEILVAAQDIQLGATIEPNVLAWRQWPLDAVNAAYIRRSEAPDMVAALVGTVARNAFFAGEPVTEDKLATTDGGLLAAMLPAGMRAAAIAITTDTGAGGFILPNDRVDVIMTRRVEDAAGERFVTETILQNIRVLAIDQAIAERNGEQVVVGRTATLELTPQQAEIITVAQQMSDRLALALRSLADAQQVIPVEADALHLITGDRRNDAVTVVRNGVLVQVPQ